MHTWRLRPDGTPHCHACLHPRSIRPHAPYLPSNIDYMAANNGLESGPAGREAVRSTIFDASYLVLVRLKDLQR